MKKIFYYILIIGIFSNCTAQKKETVKTKKTSKMYYPVITKDFEKFDIYKYELLKQKDKFHASEFLPDGTYIEMDSSGDTKQYWETPPNGYVQIYKSYYKNGNVKIKGLLFNGDAFLIGKWYEFDEQGRLIKEVDYDKDYKFTFEDVLRFCEQEKIRVDKGFILQSTGFHTTIRKNSLNNTPVWEINYQDGIKPPSRPFTQDKIHGEMLIYEVVVLDGNTGKIISKRTSGLEDY